MIASLRESKTRLSEFVQLASGGEEILITVRGKPKARLLPVEKPLSSNAQWMRELASLRASVKSKWVDSNVWDEVREDRW